MIPAPVPQDFCFSDMQIDTLASRSSVDENSESYLQALSNARELLSPGVKAENIRLCANYFVEEMTIVTCLCEQGWHVCVYPGSVEPLRILSEGNSPDIPEPGRKLIQVDLGLNRKGAYFVTTEQQASLPRPGSAYRYHALGNLKEDDWRRIAPYAIRKRFQAGDVLTPVGATDRMLKLLLKLFISRSALQMDRVLRALY
uniref:Uncharacterized protein n=1 Tax=Candidatus Kentrum sp. FM TaxID=2126340 RepID=A0A450WBD8_9GAMM|nr:MAG: hypothetical protein BECKFM1743C_GA0114222_103206 [Candidatus Kentron sp. FM]VFJ63077.1 MAG: hypothetical protein BECKFM1743A_GA0114220_103236 [Candidatus Kentron sp. FM]VFK14325.1 MAG: hypothetical protein BECKFM1743B_GA0114221_103166 [Candidatus Kentron sp. FM]